MTSHLAPNRHNLCGVQKAGSICISRSLPPDGHTQTGFAASALRFTLQDQGFVWTWLRIVPAG